MHQYSREFRSVAEIAAMVGCSYETARAAIERHQIPAIPYGVRRALRARLEAQRETDGAGWMLNGWMLNGWMLNGGL